MVDTAENEELGSLRRDGYGFRLRGENVTRLEGFSDGVFAFALTLLVVTLDVPKSFSQLQTTISGFVGFGLCFLLLIGLWYRHRLFFRRYGLDDDATIAWNSALLFLVLFFVYPLKFLITLMMAKLLHIGVGQVQDVEAENAPTLMIIYSGGYLAVHAVFFMMHKHAWRKRTALHLDALEELLTRESVTICSTHIAIAGLSILIALIGGARWTPYAGWVYFLLGPALMMVGSSYGKRARALRGG